MRTFFPTLVSLAMTGLSAVPVIAGPGESGPVSAPATNSAPWRETARPPGEFHRCGAIPYADIRNMIEARYQGRVVGQQFLAQQCQYKFMVLRKSGRVLSVLADAQSGGTLDVKGEKP